jgi:arylsulfatase A-like enzyme
MNKNITFWGCLSAVATVFPSCGGKENKSESPAKPNIIFILADDMGYGDLACYGNKYIKTPNIDRLAETGTRFTQCYAGSGVSSPSRCALMTGKNTGNTTIRDNFCKTGGMEGKKGENTIRRMHILPEDTTIATVLRDAGYRTCLVNKWHLDGFNPEATPLNRGFDEFYGWLVSTSYSNDPYYYPYWRFDNYELHNIEENANDRRIMHNTDISTGDAIEFIHRNTGNPFFLYLAFDAPHEPYVINETKWYDDEEDWDMTTKRYASLITHMDAAIGRLIAEVDRLGLRENTLIIFASDNGAAVQAPIEELGCNASLRGRKALLYEGGIRIPFIVNMPNAVPVQTLDNLIYFPDVMPTLAALAGAETPQNINGINVLPLFKGEPLDTDNRLLYWEFPGTQRAARKGEWKVVSTKKDTPLELYNIKEDMTESHDLAQEHPDIVAAFEREMEQIRKPSPNWPLEGEIEGIPNYQADGKQ